MSKEELDRIIREEITPVSYAWRNPRTMEEGSMLGWWLALRIEDKRQLFEYWYQSLATHRGKSCSK